MKARDLFSKVLSLALVAVMLLGMLPVFASAEETEQTPTDSDGLVTSKTVTVNNDGTYTIRLEAYATGTVSTNKTTTPTDIVLVLDDSGSMDYCITCGKQNVTNNSTHTLYTYTPVYDISTSGTTYYYNQKGDQARYCDSCHGWFTTRHYYSHGGDRLTPKTSADSEGTQFYTRTNAGTESCTKRITALQNAAKLFIYETYVKNQTLKDTDPKHRISVVTFASSGSTKVALTDVTGTASKSDTGVVTATAGNVKTLIDSINGMNSSGATNAEDGLAHAVSEFNKVDYTTDTNKNRQKIVIFFTDGVPTTNTAFSYEVAAGAINNANTLKGDKYEANVYSISVLSDADVNETSGKDTSADDTAKMNTYMNAVSSNYPEATASGSDGGWGASYSVDLGEGSPSNGYYKKATNAADLTSIFQEISNSVGSADIELGSEAVMKDIIAPSFTLPSNFGEGETTVKVYTADYKGKDESDEPVFDTPVDQNAQIFIDTTAPEGTEGIYVTVSKANKTVDITGFDYSANYCVDGSEDGKVQTSGQKIIVEISGIEVDPEHFIAGEVLTNDPDAGIYDKDGNVITLIENFNECKVKLASKSYVLDYAKSFEMTPDQWGLSDVKHVTLLPGKITKFETGALDLTNGRIVPSDTGYTYTPQTMSWNGFDRFYAFGDELQTTKNVVTSPLWAQVNVIPANNVYYEDSFVTNEDTAVVGIKYGGSFEVTTGSENTETPNENSETPNTPIHGGWKNGDLANDPKFSEGYAHKMSKDATATFTFTGTGVDIYSYTDMTTGAVRVILNNEEGVTQKYMIVDNLSETGKYYQIPTVSFQGLKYGTYTVQLKVNAITNLVSGERSTYYLDGIRIYNPLGTSAEDPVADKTVKDAYGNNLNACFAEVRDVLISANTLGDGQSIDDVTVNGALFIEDPEAIGEGDIDIYSSTLGDFDDYGPKNEVYLDAGQAIAFQVDLTTGNNYYVGLKAMEGEKTTAKYTAGGDAATANITHSTDLYYQVIPNDKGYVVIQNTGNALLSITKIQITNKDIAVSDTWYKPATVEELATYAASFSDLALMGTGVAVEIPENYVPEVDIEIENPEVENEGNEMIILMKKLFDSFQVWFGR